MPEPSGDAVLESHLRRPRHLPDLCLESGVVDEGLYLGGGHRLAGLAVGLVSVTGRAGAEQAPGRSLAECEQEQQASATGDHMERVRHQVGLELEVGEHDLLAVGAALPGDPRGVPHPARGTVTPDDVPRRGQLLATRPAQGRPRAFVGQVQRVELDSPLHLDASPMQNVPQHLLHVRLPHHRQMRVRRASHRRLPQPDVHDPAPQVQLRARAPVGTVEQGCRHPERTQALEGPGVHDHRSRASERLAPAIDDAYRRAVLVGLQRKRETGGPSTYDEHVRSTHDMPTGHHQSGVEGSTSSRPGSASTSSRRRPGTTWKSIDPGSLTSASTLHSDRA